jgi:membrane associated rhomboid family serine protease
MTEPRRIWSRIAHFRGVVRETLVQFPVGASLLALAAAVTTLLPFLNRLCIDERSMEGRFEPWRVFTGHLVHGNVLHLVLNLLVFTPLAVFRERRVGIARLALEYATIALCVSAGVRLLGGAWTTYCGLSGVAYGFLVIVLAADRTLLGLTVIAALAVKTALEAASGGWIFGREGLESSLGVTYLYGSHVAGMAAGMLLVVLGRLATRHGSVGPQPARNRSTTLPGSSAPRMAPITAAPDAPARRSSAARSGRIPPSA